MRTTDNQFSTCKLTSAPTMMLIKILAEELLICSHQVLRSYFTAFEVFDTKCDIRPTSMTPGKGKSVWKNKLTRNIEEIPQEQMETARRMMALKCIFLGTSYGLKII